MASLQSSFTVLHTNPRISPFQKPSSLGPSKARVSCSGRIDRRNMLLGLGGLYGSSSLVPGHKAEALPLLPPDLSKCDPEGAYTPGKATADNPNPDPIFLDLNCCPPYTQEWSDYVLPRPPKNPRVRTTAHGVRSSHVTKYEAAIKKMKDLDRTDPDDPRGFTQQANIHCAYCNGPYDQEGYPGLDIQVHNSWIFFPFHRWYLYFFERICGELIGDPTFALPLWNWDHPNGMTMPPAFAQSYSPLYDVNRDAAHQPPAVVDLNIFDGTEQTTPDQMVKNNLAQMYSEMIGGVDSAISFMGQPYRAGSAPLGLAGMGTSERGSHTGIHVWVGSPDNPNREDMGNFYSSGYDPLFYSHHANVDRMWTLWENIPADYPKTIDDPDFLDAAFMFYDEKKNLVRVKARDCLDYTKMGYKYQELPTPWMKARPAQRPVAANAKKLAKTAQTARKAFPSTLAKTIRVSVPKPTKGKSDEVLVLEKVVTDNTKLIKFSVFVNDEDNDTTNIARAEYAGGLTQIPHRARTKETKGDFRLNLKELYENINIPDDEDVVVVTIVPQFNGDAVTIGGIKIVPRVAA